MAYRIFIFDFDYTLGDSTLGIIAFTNFALKQMGFLCPDKTKIKSAIGLSLQ
ncbi:MAG: HAD hydrolase-like protein, partial [Firmicutes bacterium]|nr:HAD hydrolase-like protein [Bacillota bacterium]